jgi:hypothetical protein
VTRSLPAALAAAALLVLTACADDDGDAADDAIDDPIEDDAADDDLDDDAEPDDDVADGDGDGDEYDIADQPDAAASFVSPEDGDTVSGAVPVEMAAEGVDIVPADAPAVGEAHLHVMVDIGCVDEGEIIPGPSDEATEEGYVHFGDGSTEAEIELEPGTYELCVQLADGVHRAFGDTETITVTVE